MIDTRAPDASARLLTLALERVRPNARDRVTIDVGRARHVLDAAALLNHERVATEAHGLLVAAVRADYERGRFSNFELDDAAIDRLRRRRTSEELDRDYPMFRRADVAARAAWEEATRLAWAGSATEALAFARAHPRGLGETPLHVEVALTLAVRGDFAVCRGWIADGTVPTTHAHVLRMVLVIELARAGLLDEANRELTALQPLEPWTATCLALGLAGRCPWSIYPFADY